MNSFIVGVRPLGRCVVFFSLGLWAGCTGDPSNLDRPQRSVQRSDALNDGCGPMVGGMPPPISGGTLALSADGSRLCVSDPDRGRVLIVDPSTQTVLTTISTDPTDEPGRATPGETGSKFHVVLRASGELATVSQSGALSRIAVCPAPRGVTRSAVDGYLYVTCAGGEVVVLNSAGTAVITRALFSSDQRDVIAVGDRLLGTSFRAPLAHELFWMNNKLNLGRNAVPRRWLAPPSFYGDRAYLFEPTAAWRVTSSGADRFYMIHQRALVPPVGDQEAGFTCVRCGGSVVHTALTSFSVTGAAGMAAKVEPSAAWPVPNATLPVDVSISPDRSRALIAAAGNLPGDQLVILDLAQYATASAANPVSTTRPTWGTNGVIAVQFLSNHSYVIQTRQPSTLVFVDESGPTPVVNELFLGGANVAQDGHTFFHRRGTVPMACASCHVEATDDGRTWTYGDTGTRRTQNLRQHLSHEAPFHWTADLANLQELMNEGIHRRLMRTTMVTTAEVTGLQTWINGLRPPCPTVPTSSAGLAAVERGRMLYNSFACSDCHDSVKFPRDIGTGGGFVAPRLQGLRFRAPYMHNGCARTIADRFLTPECGGSNHRAILHGRGGAFALSRAQVNDFVAYLSSL